LKQPKRNIPDAGASAGSRKVTVEDVMTRTVETAGPGVRIRDIRALLAKHRFHCMPIVDDDGLPLGIVTTSDLIDVGRDDRPVSSVMSKKLYTVSLYSGVELAARIMRNHRIHHVVVTHERRVVGIVSSFDLLALVDGKRFVARNAASRSSKGGKRRRSEQA
jgi:CBS domain-containing protein